MQYRNRLVILAVLALPVIYGCSASSPKDKIVTQSDDERLQGEWVAISIQLESGETFEIPEFDPPMMIFVFEGNGLSRYRKGKENTYTTDATFKINESSTPKELDWVTYDIVDGVKRPLLIKCIYKFEGERLYLCLDEGPEFSRPSQFMGSKGQGLFVFRPTSK